MRTLVLIVALSAGVTGCGRSASEPGTATSKGAASSTSTTGRGTSSVPPAKTAKMTPSKVLRGDRRYSTFEAIVNRSGLADEFDKKKNLTVFAPDNDTFEDLGPSLTKKLQTDKALAATFVNQHLVAQRLDLTRLVTNTKPLTTLAGTQVETRYDPSGKGVEAGTLALFVGKAQIVSVDIPTKNGILYVVNGVTGR
jgi:uncharacterized surface protein with fasciclin (FAS1) repeats